MTAPNVKTWQAVAGTAVAALSVLGLMGFLSPSSRAARNEDAVSEVRAEVEKVKDRVNGHDVDIVGMKKDIDYAVRGIEALMDKEGVTPRPRRRGH